MIAVSLVIFSKLFLSAQSGEDRARARSIIREVFTELLLDVLTFRSVPVIDAALGQRAQQSRPWMEQVLIRRADGAGEAGEPFERLLYRARKLIARRARESGVLRLYVASLSSRTIVYKGLMLAEELDHFYPDLSDTDYRTGSTRSHT